MTIKQGAIYAGIILSIVFGYRACRKHDTSVDAGIKSPILTPTEQTKVIVDTRRHTITTVTRRADGGTDTRATFLPGSGAAVSIGLDKSVHIVSRSWGTEVNPFVGCALGSDIRGRAALGVNLFYVQRFELGGGLLVSTDIHDTRAFVGGTYNAYSNILVGLGIDNRKTVHLIAALKF